MKDRFTVTTYSVQSILSLIKSDDIAIPEIQRPFVWDGAKVRDLIDSLYHGYPTGYLITWKNPDVKIKGGGTSEGKTVLIDGQQRVTALMAALVGRPVLNDDYDLKRIKIAFNPLYKGEGTPLRSRHCDHRKGQPLDPRYRRVFQRRRIRHIQLHQQLLQSEPRLRPR